MHTKTELDVMADRGLRRISPDSFVGVAATIALPLSGAGSVVADQAPTFIAQHVGGIMKTDLRARSLDIHWPSEFRDWVGTAMPQGQRPRSITLGCYSRAQADAPSSRTKQDSAKMRCICARRMKA
jgi:hypothetical protein